LIFSILTLLSSSSRLGLASFVNSAHIIPFELTFSLSILCLLLLFLDFLNILHFATGHFNVSLIFFFIRRLVFLIFTDLLLLFFFFFLLISLLSKS
jgi:hypothetical protein